MYLKIQESIYVHMCRYNYLYSDVYKVIFCLAFICIYLITNKVDDHLIYFFVAGRILHGPQTYTTW